MTQGIEPPRDLEAGRRPADARAGDRPRTPAGRLIRRWGISVASLASGIVTLLVFRRGLPHVAWIVGYLLLLWLLYTLTSLLRQRLARHGPRVVVAADYTVQTLDHGLLMFVLPGYFASTTADGATAPFFTLLVAAALLTTIDPWYGAALRAWPWVGDAVCALALFAGWNVALPLVGVPPGPARLLASLLAGLAITARWWGAARTAPVAFSARVGAGLRASVPVLIVVAGVWLLPEAVPPAPLHLVGAVMARGVVDREPVGPVVEISRAALLGGGGLYAFTPVAGPPGLEQPVTHQWRHDGRAVTTIALGLPVRGGRRGGFRTFSRKVDFPPDPTGRWTVDVLTPSGQLIGRLRFRVTP